MTALSVGPGPAESAMDQRRKCLTVVIFRFGLIPRCTGAGSYAVRNPPNDFKLS